MTGCQKHPAARIGFSIQLLRITINQYRTERIGFRIIVSPLAL